MTDDTPAPATPGTSIGEPETSPLSAGANFCATSSLGERLHPEPDEADFAYRTRLKANSNA